MARNPNNYCQAVFYSEYIGYFVTVDDISVVTLLATDSLLRFINNAGINNLINIILLQFILCFFVFCLSSF